MKKLHTGTFKSVCAVADPERAAVDMKQLYFHSLFNHTVSIFLCYRYSDDHRSSELKVYSLSINTDVYGSNQNRVNHLLRVASNIECINYT